MDSNIEIELNCDCHKNLGLFLMPKGNGWTKVIFRKI